MDDKAIAARGVASSLATPQARSVNCLDNLKLRKFRIWSTIGKENLTRCDPGLVPGFGCGLYHHGRQPPSRPGLRNLPGLTLAERSGPFFRSFVINATARMKRAEKLVCASTTRARFSASCIPVRSASCPANRRRARYSGALSKRMRRRECPAGPAEKAAVRGTGRDDSPVDRAGSEPGVLTGLLNRWCGPNCPG